MTATISLSHLKERYEFYTASEDILAKEIDSLINQRKRCGLFNLSRKELKERIMEKRNSINNLNIQIEIVKDVITDFSSFDAKTILPVIAKYISEKEEEEYSIINVKEDDLVDYVHSDYLSYENGLTLIKKPGASYNIITTNENIEVINKFNHLFCTNIQMTKCKNRKYVMLEEKSKYSLLNGLSLNDEFKEYPYLIDLALSLLDTKLSNPNISDKELLSRVSSKPHIKEKNK